MTAFLYALTVLIWGLTWYAIKLQLGVVPVEASIVYRFALAALCLLAGLALFGRLQRIALREHRYLVLLGCCLFSLNFICFYTATGYVPSGLVAVVFSGATIFNALNAFLFHGRRPSPRILTGAVLGSLGLTGLFWTTLTGTALDGNGLIGLGLALAGTYLFSLGNMLSARNQKAGLDVASSNAYGMTYGSVILTLFCLASGVPFAFDTSVEYVGGLLFLAIPGSVIGFTAYLTVVGRLGPERAAYMTVLFPVVALAVSTWLEGYQWSLPSYAGLLAILAGNLLILTKFTLTPFRKTETA